MEEKQHNKLGKCQIIPDEEFSDTFTIKINGSTPTFGEQQDLCDLFQDAYNSYERRLKKPSQLIEDIDVCHEIIAEQIAHIEKCVVERWELLEMLKKVVYSESDAIHEEAKQLIDKLDK